MQNPAARSTLSDDPGEANRNIARAANPFPINTGPTVPADVNNDGRSDLLSLSNLGITTMLGQANSTFATVSTPLWYATQGIAAVGDFNKDGKPDLLVFEFPSLRVWLGNGDGTFKHSNLVDVGGQFVGNGQCAVTDLDGDGNLDVVISPDPNPGSPMEPLIVLYGNGDGTFQPPVAIPLSHLWTHYGSGR